MELIVIQLILRFLVFSGDPVANVGWLYTSETDQRIMLNTGPFQLEVGKPVSMIFAYIVGQGANRLESISKAREIAEYTHNFYLSNFGEFPVGVEISTKSNSNRI